MEKKENVFGGGRFNFKVDKIPLEKDEFIKALEKAQEGVKTYSKMEESTEKEVQAPEGELKEESSGEETEIPRRGRRK